MSEAKQELGPLQRKWVEALRSGKYEQGQRCLRFGETYCCLGVACEVAISSGIDVRVTAPWNDQVGFYSGERNVLPVAVVEKMQFRSQAGEIIGYLRGHDRLWSANDSGVTFAEIADFVEAHPSAIFTKPA